MGVNRSVIAYVDSSVVLRWILREPEPIFKIEQYDKLYSSRLLRLECVRTLQRLLLDSKISQDEHATRIAELQKFEQLISIVSLRERIWRSAEQFCPSPLGTLDAIHLAIAQLLRDSLENTEVEFLTHDKQLARCVQAVGMVVVGV